MSVQRDYQVPDQPGDAVPARGPARARAVGASHTSLVALLNLIRKGHASTRLELERQSELGRAVVADRLATLAALGLVEEGDLGPALGGRAPRQILFRKRAGYILSATIDHAAMSVGVADLSANLIAEHHESVDLASGPRPVVERLVTIFRWMLEEHAASGPLLGIGLAVPSAIARPGTEGSFPVVLSGFQGWENFPFVETIATQLDSMVWVRSGVHVMTMGEFGFGAGAGLTDMIFVKLGRSITAGVIGEGKLQRGAQGASGTIGATVVGSETLESIAGTDAILREARRASKTGESAYLARISEKSGTVSVADVGHGAQLGDPFCIELLSRCGRAVGEVLASFANLLNPSLIVLGGNLAQTGDIVLAAVREAVYRQSHFLVTRDLRIGRSQMGGSAGLLGAALVVSDELFDPDFLRSWIAGGTPRAHPDWTAFLTRATAGLQMAPPRPRPPGEAVGKP